MNKVMMYCVIAILLFLFTALATAQQTKYSLIWMNIRDNAFNQDTGTVFFGNHPNATYGIDSLCPSLIEFEAPPYPPGFDLRWVGLPGQPRNPNALCPLDLRGIPTNPTKADTFKLRMVNPDSPST
ncbi:MAG: hypothetical protein HY800_03320, partial [Ignavibacteriales bacterium]|nr:hypothetical protein [Ignavibacteriales bacterium]